MRARIKKNDTVMVIAGRERGKTGKVLRVIPAKERALIERLNLVKRHQKPRGAAERLGHHREGSADPPLQHHDHVRQVQRAGADGQAPARRRPQRARLPPLRRSVGPVITHGPPARRIARTSCPHLMKELGYKNVNQVPRARQGRAQHGPRRGDPERQGDGLSRRRDHRDRRTEAGGHQVAARRSPTSSCARTCRSAAW